MPTKTPLRRPAAARKDEAQLRPIGAGKHEPVPLPFDAGKLKGISRKMITSHWENNYVGAVKNLNKVEADLARAAKDTPPYVIYGLKERELLFSNSLILHEHYFGNLGGNGKPSGAVVSAITEAFGGLLKWEEQFRATGMSLAGGTGWAVLELNFHTGELRSHWSGGHTQALAFGRPLLVLDMYEHAHQIDYGAKADAYVDAFMSNVNWDEVDRRYDQALRALKALRS